ncbi:MoaB/Mog domain-containing protein [Haematococcus lacustris]
MSLELRSCLRDDPEVQRQYDRAVQVLKRALALYSPDRIAFSFNGGKDSTVLLHILLAVMHDVNGPPCPGSTITKSYLPPTGLGGLRSFLFTTTNDFPEVLEFVKAADTQYQLGLEYLSDPDFRRGLTTYLSSTGVQAVVLGTRSDDPNASGQAEWCPSSEGWPGFMRVNPIFHWTYHQVWTFLRAVGAPYCTLYDAGYTSLGARTNTCPNSALAQSDGTYLPAWQLSDGALEREGRGRQPARPAPPSPTTPLTPNAATDHPPAPAPHPPPAPTESTTFPPEQQQQPKQTHQEQQQQQQQQQQQANEGAKGLPLGLGCSIQGMNTPQPGSSGLEPTTPAHPAGGAPADTVAPTAALLVIGDELLSGKVEDTNTTYLCQELHSLGCTVRCVVIVPDDIALIAEQVARLAPQVGVLLTCGGVGPTLDDVTMAGVAAGLGVPLTRHTELEARMRRVFGSEITESHLKMAEGPEGRLSLVDYRLEGGEPSRFPLLRCDPNIYVLPGVPHLLRQKWQALKEVLVKQMPLARPFHNQVFRLGLWDETLVAAALEKVQAAADGVSIGSYPVTDQGDGAGVLITLEASDTPVLDTASNLVRFA